jgi:quinol monooxygenase YgiN
MTDHDKTLSTGIVVSGYYRVHPDDRQKFIDAVIPDMTAAQELSGCIWYAFGQDVTDPNAFHLPEGWQIGRRMSVTRRRRAFFPRSPRS